MSRITLGTLALALALSLGCRGSDNGGQTDANVNPHQDGGTGQQDANTNGDGGGGSGWDSIKAMKNAGLASQTAVTINSAVVTALSGNYKNLYVGDLDGGAKSGIVVFCNFTSTSNPCPIPKTTMQTFKPGMKVKVVGTIGAYNNQQEVYPTAITILDQNATQLPPFNQITAAQAVETLTTSDYAGSLVEITGVSSSTPLTVKNTTPGAFQNASYSTDCLHGPPYSAFEVWDGTSTIAVTTNFYRAIDFGTDANCIIIYDGGTPSDKLIVVGDKFEKLSGILDVDPFDMNGLVLSPAAKDQYTYVNSGDHDGGM